MAKFARFLWILAPVFFVTCDPVFAAKTFVYCSEASPVTFNPQLASDGATYNASSRPLYNRLVSFKKGSTELEPGLAESWEISKDGRTYVFRLRKNVSFHSTHKFKPLRKFNADDVIFTFHRMLKKDHPFHSVSGGIYEMFNSMSLGELIQDVKKIDEHTVQFSLARPEAPFLANLAMDFASILSAEYGAQLLKHNEPALMDQEPVGTGPYRLKSYVKDSTIRYESNPDYFAGAPPIKHMVYAITPDPAVRFQRLRRGECQFAAEPSPTDIELVRQDHRLKLLEQPGMNVAYLAMNTEKKPFDNLFVRQAVYHALNREAYIKAVYLGQAQVAHGPLPPVVWGYQKLDGLDYNPEKARMLLAKAGYPKGFKTELWILPISRPYMPNGKKVGEMMQADLKAIGIEVETVTYKWATYLEKSRRGEHSLIQMGWSGDNGDPDNFLSPLLSCAAVKSGGNLARWCDAKFDNSVKQARSLIRQSEREKLYSQAQKRFAEAVPWVPIAHSIVFKVMDKKVSGYTMNPINVEDFSMVDLR